MSSGIGWDGALSRGAADIEARGVYPASPGPSQPAECGSSLPAPSAANPSRRPPRGPSRPARRRSPLPGRAECHARATRTSDRPPALAPGRPFVATGRSITARSYELSLGTSYRSAAANLRSAAAVAGSARTGVSSAAAVGARSPGRRGGPAARGLRRLRSPPLLRPPGVAVAKWRPGSRECDVRCRQITARADLAGQLQQPSCEDVRVHDAAGTPVAANVARGSPPDSRVPAVRTPLPGAPTHTPVSGVRNPRSATHR